MHTVYWFQRKIDLIIEAKMQPWDYMAQAFDKRIRW